jgi:hypothetical protein
MTADQFLLRYGDFGGLPIYQWARRALYFLLFIFIFSWKASQYYVQKVAGDGKASALDTLTVASLGAD